MPTIKIPWRNIRNYRRKCTPPLRPPLPQITAPIDPIIRKFSNDMNNIGHITFGNWILDGNYHKNQINIHLMNVINDDVYKAVSDTLVSCRILFIQDSAIKQLPGQYDSVTVNVDKIRSGLCECINWIIGHKHFDQQWDNDNNILKYIGTSVVEYGTELAKITAEAVDNFVDESESDDCDIDTNSD